MHLRPKRFCLYYSVLTIDVMRVSEPELSAKSHDFCISFRKSIQPINQSIHFNFLGENIRFDTGQFSFEIDDLLNNCRVVHDSELPQSVRHFLAIRVLGDTMTLSAA